MDGIPKIPQSNERPRRERAVLCLGTDRDTAETANRQPQPLRLSKAVQHAIDEFVKPMHTQASHCGSFRRSRWANQLSWVDAEGADTHVGEFVTFVEH